MTAKPGRPCFLTLFLVAAVIAGAGVRSQEPTQEAKPQESQAGTPDVSDGSENTNSPIVGDEASSIAGWPLTLPPGVDLSRVLGKFSTEGFDVRGSETGDGSYRGFVMPPSGADIAASYARSVEIVKIATRNTEPPPFIEPKAFTAPTEALEAIVKSPTRVWFFNWKVGDSEIGPREAQQARVAEALEQAAFGVSRIVASATEDGTLYLHVASPPDKIPQIEEFVRTLLKEPKFWHPPQWEKFVAERKAREANPTAAPPVVRARPRIVAHALGWQPFRIFPPDNADRKAIVAMLNAAGFDAIDQKLWNDDYDSILAAPRPTGTWIESRRLLRQMLSADTEIDDLLESNFDPRAPHSAFAVKWKPNVSSREALEADLNRVIEALANSDLPLRTIIHDSREDGSNYIYLTFATIAVSDIEARVRELVEKPTIWPPHTMLMPEDERSSSLGAEPTTSSKDRVPTIFATDGGMPGAVSLKIFPKYANRRIKQDLEAAGFDVGGTLIDDLPSRLTVNWPSGADVSDSYAKLKEIVGSDGGIYAPVGFREASAEFDDTVRRSRRCSAFRWNLSSGTREEQEHEREATLDALAKSALGIEAIQWAPRDGGDVWVGIASPPDKIPQIEESVRTLVKEPKFWRPPQWEKYLAERKMREPAQAATRPVPVAAAKDSPGGLPEPSPSVSPVVPSAAVIEPAATPTASKRPVVRKGDGWHPIMIVPTNDADFDDVIVKLNGAGFDAIKVPGSNWIPTAPRPNQTYAESVPQLRALLGDDTYINPPGDGPRKTDSPHSFTCVKWTPQASGEEAQEADLNRVVTALADSDLPFEFIDHDLRRDGSNYIFAIHSADADAEVEALIRRLVEKPTLWPAQSINIHDKSVSDAASRPAAPAPKLPPVTLDLPALTTDAASPAPSIEQDRPTVIREGSVGNTTHPFLVDLPDDETDYAALERTLEGEGFDVLTFDFESGPMSMRIAPPSGADLQTSGRRLAEVLGPDAKIRDELSSIPPQVAFMADLLSTRHWFFKWKGEDESDRDRVLKALADSDVAIAELTWSRDPDGSWQVAIDSSPIDVEKIEGLIQTLVKEPKIWRPIGSSQGNEGKELPAPDSDAAESAATPPIDPPAVAEESSEAEPSDPAATPAEKIEIPKFQAKILLIETDWEKANDRAAASRLGNTISIRIFEMNRAGIEVFPPGYAADFPGDEALTVSGDLQRLGLVRQSLAFSSLDLGLSERGVEALGTVQVAFMETKPDGKRESVVWNVLVVTQAIPDPPTTDDPFSLPADPSAKPVRTYRVGVVGWKDRTAAKLNATDEAAPNPAGLLPPPLEVASTDSDESARYVGSFVLPTDQSAIVPLALPGLEGAAIIVSRDQKRSAVRSLGPLSGNATLQALTTRFPVDWDDLIRAYEASPLGVAGTQARTVEAMQDAGEPAEEAAEMTLFWRPAQEDQIDLVANAIERRYPKLEIGLKQMQGAQGATLVFTAPASSAEAIQAFAAQTLPEGATVQVGVSKGPAEKQEEARTTLIFRLENSASDDVVKLLDALKLDPGIRVVSDARTNSIILSAPDATKHKHVQAVIDLLKELDRPADATAPAPKNAAQPQPDRTASVANLRSELARIEGDVQTIAANARSASAPERSTKIDDLRRAVAAAFDLRLKLQREEAAELRDRLTKIEQNLARRERIEAAVIERRIEVLLDPALEWPEVADDEPSPSPAVAASSAGNASTESPTLDSIDIDSTSGEQSVSQPSDRGDAFAAATSLASEIGELDEEAKSLPNDDPKPVARLVAIRRRLDLLRQEFDARQEALKIDLETAQAREQGAQTSLAMTQALYQSARVSPTEMVKANAELKAAHAEVARLEVLLQQYDRVRASLPEIDGAASSASSGTPSAEPGSEDVAATSQGDASTENPAADRTLAAPGDAFSAATALATKIGRLTSEKKILKRQGASDASPLIANIDRELNLLRLEFEARNQALKMELGALKSKLDGVRVRYDQTRKLIEKGVVSQEEGQLIEAEMNAAQADLARQEVLLQQYDKARESLPSEADESASVPPELQGGWRLTKSAVVASAADGPAFTHWTFDGTTAPPTLSITGKISARLEIEFLPDAPGTFRAYDIGREKRIRDIAGFSNYLRYQIEGETLKIAASPSGPAPESVAPAEGVNYYEFERVANDATSADDEPEPGQPGSTPPAAASSAVDAEAQAERAAATALALRAADLYLEIRRIEAQTPAPPHRDLAVSLLKEQVGRLRERLEDRRAEVRKERAAAAVKLAVVQTRLDRVRRLASPKDGASQDLSATQAEFASANAALANVDASLAAFDAAAEAFDAAATSPDLPTDFAGDANGQALKKLQGFWVSTEKNISSDFGTFSPEYASVWLVAGKTMLWLGFISDDGSLYDVATEAGEEPARLTLIFEGTPQRPASIHACVFRFDGDALVVADRRDPAVDLDEVAPQPGVSYYRFERYEALEPALASFDFDAVDVDAIRNEGIDVPTGSERVPFPLRRSQAGSFPRPVSSARTQLRELAIALVKSREASESSRDPALSAEEYQRLRSQAFSQRAECFRHREQFFAERFYVERALANMKVRIESAPSAKDREELESTQAKLAECLTEIDRLAGVARLPVSVALGSAADEAWHPFVNFGQSIRPDLSLADHAEALRQAEAKLAALGPDDPGRQEAIERRDYLLEGARRLRDRWRESSTNAEGRADETRAALGKAKRAVDAVGQKMDAAEREVAVTREQYQLERDAEIIRECSRQLTELESAFPTLADDSDRGESQPSDSPAPAR